jgi:hypothetical protein
LVYQYKRAFTYESGYFAIPVYIMQCTLYSK